MWITKWKYERLIERIENLEKWREKLSDEIQTLHSDQVFLIDKYPNILPSILGSEKFYKVGLKSAVSDIMRHLGIKFKYTNCTPEAAILVKEEKAEVEA